MRTQSRCPSDEGGCRCRRRDPSVAVVIVTGHVSIISFTIGIQADDAMELDWIRGLLGPSRGLGPEDEWRKLCVLGVGCVRHVSI